MAIFEVGMGSDVTMIKAPSAAVAAMYYSINLVNTNNPFMAVVYTQDGQEFDGDMWWISLTPDEDHVKMVAGRLREETGGDMWADCEVIQS